MNNGTTSGGKIEILLVEDNAADITTTLNALKKANVCNRIHVLKDGASVLDFLLRTGAFAQQTPLPAETLILLAMNLQGAHGVDVLRKIKGDERSKAFPVIMLTGSQEERGVMQSYKLGANACIVKPLDLPKFIEAVSELRLGWLLVSGDEAHPKSG